MRESKEDTVEIRKYKDMLHLPHHVSASHPQMSMHDRAAQFSPFAALTGYEEHIRETARLTDRKIELDEYERVLLDEKFDRLRERLAERPQVRIVYFQPDEKKEGGAYVTAEGVVRKINIYNRRVEFGDGTTVDIDQIYDILDI